MDMEREEYLRRRRERREQTFIDFASRTEFADLSEDLQARLSEDAPEWDGPTVSPQGVGRGEAFGMMRRRGLTFDASNAVADARNRGADTRDLAEGIWRGPVSNITRSADRAAYTPTDEEIVAVADKWGLPESYFGKLVDWAAGPEDLDRVAEGLASLGTRDQLIADSAGPVDGFLMDFAANAINPEFLATGAVAGRALQVGSALTRMGAAARGVAAGAAADGPLEALKAFDNPNYQWTDAALSTTFSAVLGAGVGAAGAGLLSPDDLIDGQRLTDAAQAMARGQAVDTFDPNGSVGAAAYNRLGAPLERGDDGFDAPDRIGWSFGWTPAGTLWRSEDLEARRLIDDLTVNPHREDQGETMFETANRVTSSGGFFFQSADNAMREFWKEQGPGPNAGTVERLTAPAARVTGGVTDQQAAEFYEQVGQVIAGVRQTDNPHILRAAESLRDSFEDGLYHMQDSNYVGWTPGAPRAEPTGRSIPEAADVEVDRSYLPRTASREGWISVQEAHLPKGATLRQTRDNPELLRISHQRIGDRLGEVMLRSEGNMKWFSELAERWNAARKNTPNATGAVAAPMTAEQMASRIGRKYAETWSRVAVRELKEAESGMPSRAMSVQDRNAVKEIVSEVFEQGDELGELREEIIESVLDLVAPAKRRTTADSPRLMNRMDLPLDALRDRDIIKMFEWDASALAKDYRRHVAGRTALLRKGYDGPGDFEARATEVVKRAEGVGSEALRRAEKERKLLLDGLGAVTGEGRYLSANNPIFNKMKFVTQGIARMNVAAYLNNTALGPMFAEYGGFLFRSQHRALARLPAYREYAKAAKKGDVEGMKGGMMIADIMAGHGSSLVMARGVARNRYDAGLDDVTGGSSKLAGAYDELTRKSANATGRFSGMTMANDAMRTISILSDVEDMAAGKLTRFQRRQAGISDEMWPRVQAVLKDPPMTKGPESGAARIDDVALIQRAGQQDPEAWNAFIAAANRRARQLVQDPDWGHSPNWMRYPGLDLIFQFMSYPINAVNKQVVPFARAIRAKDPEALRVLFSSLFAGVGYMNRVYLQSITKDDPQAYREERLKVAEVAKAMFYYSTVSSLAPNLYDLGMDVFEGVAPDTYGGLEEAVGTDLKFGSTRASGLDASPWTGNPTYSRLSSIQSSASKLIQWENPEENAQRLASGLIPWGNAVPVQLALNAIFEPLPGDDDEIE